MDVKPNSFIWAISKIMKIMEKNCLTQNVCSSWINNDDLCEGTNPFLRKDDVNMLSTCLRCGKRKNMQ